MLAFGGMLFGMFMRSRLPEHHLSADDKDIAKVALGLVATISALVLSLLLSTAKASYDARANELIELSADILLLDRVLAYYGPEASEARLQLRAAVTGSDRTVLAERRRRGDRVQRGRVAARALHDRISRLIPVTETHHALRGQALQLMTEINRSRFLLVSHGSRSIPTAVPDRADHVADRDFHRSRPVRAGQPDRDHDFPGLRHCRPPGRYS